MRYFGVPVARRDGSLRRHIVPGTFSGGFIEAFEGANFNVSNADLNYRGRLASTRGRLARFRHREPPGAGVQPDEGAVLAKCGGLFPPRREYARALGAPGARPRHGSHRSSRKHRCSHPPAPDPRLRGRRGELHFDQVSENFGGAHNPAGITFDEFDTVNPKIFSQAHSPGRGAGAGRAQRLFRSQSVGGVRRGAVQPDRQARDRRRAALRRLRHDLRSRRAHRVRTAGRRRHGPPRRGVRRVG